jgi:hypothetical protein
MPDRMMVLEKGTMVAVGLFPHEAEITLDLHSIACFIALDCKAVFLRWHQLRLQLHG